VLEKRLAYKIDQIEVIEPEHTELLRAVKGKDYITLMTCTPYGVNSHRLLVRGIRTKDESGKQKTVKKNALTKEQKILLIAVIVTTGLMGIVIVAVILHRRKSSNQE
jgi:sortase A